MTGSASPRAELRRRLASGGFVAAPGAFDPFTAMIIERAGFPAVYLGGNAMGVHLGIGQPFVTMSEAVECAMRAERAVSCPLIVDADAGFGDPAHTYRTVQEFERARVAAIHIDDQPAPKRAHYHLGRGRVTPVEEMVEKLRVALEARTDPDFMIIGKTDALRLHSQVETLKRCEALVGTGIDMLLVVDLSPEDAPVFRREFPDTPLAWIGGHRGPVPTLAEIESGGFQLAVYPFTTLAAVAESVRDTWKTVLEDGRPEHDEEMLSRLRSHLLELVGMTVYWQIERETTERVTDR